MTKPPKPDLTEHEDEAIPFNEVIKKLIESKPALKKPDKNQREKK